MTIENKPQSGKATSVTDFQKRFAEKTAEKMIRNQEKVERRAATFQERAGRPLPPSEIKAFFDKKREQEANFTPEQKQEKVSAFFQRKADQKVRDEKGHFDTLKTNPAYQDVSDERLFKLAEMRNDFEKENLKAKLSEDKMGKALATFDKSFADPKKLDAVMKAAETKATELKETRSTPAKQQDAEMSM